MGTNVSCPEGRSFVAVIRTERSRSFETNTLRRASARSQCTHLVGTKEDVVPLVQTGINPKRTNGAKDEFPGNFSVKGRTREVNRKICIPQILGPQEETDQ
jgi:hypothetical protein